mgnify:CR=1 FL=1
MQAAAYSAATGTGGAAYSLLLRALPFAFALVPGTTTDTTRQPIAPLSPHMDAWDADALPAAARVGALEAATRDAMCLLHNETTALDGNGCSLLTVSRLGATAVERSVERARACALAWETDCVLGEEVGLHLPVAFVLDSRGDIRPLIAPRLLPIETTDDAPNVTEHTVRHVHPLDPSRVFGTHRFRSPLRVEFLGRDDGRRGAVGVQRELLHGSVAFCVQLLRAAYGPSCWEALD